MKNSLIFLFTFLAISSLAAQQFSGFSSSNYSGISGIYENPANIADNRYRIDVNLSSNEFSVSNNYLAFSTQLLNLTNNPLADTSYKNSFQRFRSNFFQEKDWSSINQARIHQTLNLQGPSVLFSIGKNGFAITSAIRQYLHVDNLNPQTANFALKELNDPRTWNINLNNKNLNVVGAGWSELGIAYGREIWTNGQHYIKGGVHFKVLIAMFSGYFYADELVLNFQNADTMSVKVSDIRFGYSNNISDNILDETFGSFDNFINRTGVALDFGFVYEWRPQHKENELLKNKNKYKLKVGVSFSDLGAITFDRGTFAGSFDGFSYDWVLDTFSNTVKGVESFGAFMKDSLTMTTNRDPYVIRLPSRFNLQVDYHVWKWFYANFSARIGFDPNGFPLAMHALNSYTLTPRFEHPWFDVGLPITIDGYNNFQAGFYARVGPLFIGSINCWNLLVGPNVQAANWYGGLKVPIPFGKKK